MQLVVVSFIVLCLAMIVMNQQPSYRKRARPQRASYIKFHSIKQCDKESAISSVNTSSHRGADNIEYMDVDMVFSRPAKLFSKMKVLVTKCADAVSFNTCEYFLTWSWSLGVCQIVTAKNVPWTALLQNVQPEIRCPHKAGLYRWRDCTFDMSTLYNLGMPIEGSVYIVEAQIYDQNQDMYVCVLIEFEIPKASG